MPVINGLHFIGDCSWQPSGEPEPHGPAGEEPGLREPWLGRADLLDTFLLTYPIGFAYLGGYITDRRPQNHSPGMMSCDLIVALQPDLENEIAYNETVQLTSTAQAKIYGAFDANGRLISPTNINANASSSGQIDCERSVSYLTRQTRYVWYSEGEPDGARFTTIRGDFTPRILRSVITARDGATEARYGGANAPSRIATALFLTAADRVTSHVAEKILGTPWYRCTDTVARELAGS